jgi:hypothetical protein
MNFLFLVVAVFWHVMASSLVEVQQHFRRTHYLHHQAEECTVCKGDVVDTGT